MSDKSDRLASGLQPHPSPITKRNSDERKSSGVDPYEQLIAESPQGSIYCQPWWLEAVAPGDWRILTIERGDSLVAAWPLVASKSRRGLKVFMPPLTQKLGILFAPTESKYAERLSAEHNVIEQMIERLPRVERFEHCFHEEFLNWLPFHWCGFSQTTRYTYVLEGILNSTDVWKGMRTASRQRIRKATKYGLVVQDDCELDQFIELQRMVYERQGIMPDIPEETIRRLDEACRHRGKRKIFSAVDSQGRIHSALYLVWDKATAYYLMSGSDPALRQSGSLYLLHWEAIKFSATVAERYDFEGSMLRHVESSFRDLGGQQRPYFEITKRPPVTPGRVLEYGVRRALRALKRRGSH